MTEPEILTGIKLGLKGIPTADADEIARVYMKKSILRVGRINGVTWNKEAIEFTLTSGQQKYVMGVDIPNLRGIGTLFRTDTQTNPIPVVDVNEFGRSARGSSTTGKPILATIHSDSVTLEFYPIPSGNYTIWGYIKKKIVNLADIPEEFHDVIIDYAIASIGASEDKSVAVAFARAGLDDLKDETLTVWDENVIPLGRHLVEPSSIWQDPDSGNLRGG